MKKLRIEIMTEILSELGVVATEEQVAQIVEDFVHHMDMEREVESNQFTSIAKECSNCKRLESELKEITHERDSYRNSVSERRNTKHVWIERGEVKYRAD